MAKAKQPEGMTLVLADSHTAAKRAGYTTNSTRIVATPRNCLGVARVYAQRACDRLIVVNDPAIMDLHFHALAPMFRHSPNCEHLEAKLLKQVRPPHARPD